MAKQPTREQLLNDAPSPDSPARRQAASLRRDVQAAATDGHRNAKTLPPEQLADPVVVPRNERNLAALQLLVDELSLHRSYLTSAREAAEWLAARGVLVPAALTDDQAVNIGADAVGSVPTDPAEIALCVREGLEKIAKGER